MFEVKWTIKQVVWKCWGWKWVLYFYDGVLKRGGGGGVESEKVELILSLNLSFGDLQVAHVNKKGKWNCILIALGSQTQY